MTRRRNRLVKHLTWGTFLVAALAMLAQPAVAAPGESCSALGAQITRTGQQRQEAVARGENAWKLVVPFAVLARKASSKAAVDEAERQLVVLRQRAADEGCTPAAADDRGIAACTPAHACTVW